MPDAATAFPIEIHANADHLLGMPPRAFLRDYWQKRPLLIRQAFPGFVSPLSPEDLAGLACEEAALSRIVRHDRKRDRWTLKTGPFDEAVFPKLPDKDWTLLVQDVDKWDPDVRALLERFDFLPRWRIDDVMISFAAPGGSVGAHVDQYDVFLLQGAGRRHWQISTDPNAPTAFRDDVELKLLRTFDPTHEWTLEPGDMLYLPPGVPHHGVAVDACLTFSVGMRAPSQAEMVTGFAEDVADRLDEALRYADPDLAPAFDGYEIGADAIARARRALERLHGDDVAIADWFGRFVSAYRATDIAAPPKPPGEAAILAALADGGALAKHPFLRTAWTREGLRARLFANGSSWPMGTASASALAATTVIDATGYDALDDDARRALLDLAAAGGFVLRARRGSRKR